MSTYGGGYQPGVGYANAGSAGAGGVPGSSTNVSATAAYTTALDGSDLTPAQVNALDSIKKRAGMIPVLAKRGTGAPSYGVDTYAGGSAPGPMPAGQEPDQYRDYSDVVSSIQTMDPATVAAIQQELMNAHLYSNSYYGKGGYTVIPGQVDAGTLSAWKQAVTTAALQQKTVDEVLADATSNAAKSGFVAPKIGPRVTLTNPEDVRSAALSAGQRVLGRRPDPGFIDNLVAQYHNLEFQASQPQADGSYVSQPGDPEAFAEQMIRQLHPVDAAVHDYLNIGNEIVDRLSAPAGSNLPTSGTVSG